MARIRNDQMMFDAASHNFLCMGGLLSNPCSLYNPCRGRRCYQRPRVVQCCVAAHGHVLAEQHVLHRHWPCPSPFPLFFTDFWKECPSPWQRRRRSRCCQALPGASTACSLSLRCSFALSRCPDCAESFIRVEHFF